jgi:hypothetical protein
MVKHKKTGEVSALKCLAKAHLIRTQQQQNVRREKVRHFEDGTKRQRELEEELELELAG